MIWLEFGLNLKVFSDTEVFIREWRRVTGREDIDVKYSEAIVIDAVNLYQIQGAFYLMFIGYSVALTTALGELVGGRCILKKMKEK